MFIKKFLVITRKVGDNGMFMFYKSVFLFVGFTTLGPEVLTNNCNLEKREFCVSSLGMNIKLSGYYCLIPLFHVERDRMMHPEV